MNVEQTTSDDTMTDVISYIDNQDSLNFPTDTKDEYDPGPSISTDEDNIKVNQGNYSNQYQIDDFVVVKYDGQ